jgi:hypothetical protein
LTISILEYSELVGCIQHTPQLGARAASAVEAYGGDLNLLGLAGADANGNAPRPAIAEAVLRAVSFMTPAAAARVVALARKAERGLASVADDHEIGPIAYLRDGRTLIGSAFVKDGLVELVAGGSPNWPSAISAAARRFQARIHDRPESLWFDRYLGVGITALQQFLATVANLGYVGRLHLLSSQKGIASISPTEKAAFETAAQGWIRKGMVVDWRLISPADWAPLHDRQLVSMGRIDGYSLPPADRVVCATPAGNEVDRYLPLAPVSLLNDAWRNAASYIP